ncbi:MAG: RNA polymerase sigma factor [Thermomicrobiales bacterium]
MTSPIDDQLRQLAPRVLGTLVRRYGDFDTAEDAVQEALVTAAMRWPDDGIPTNPYGWLITVASRRLTDQWRSDSARRRREQSATDLLPREELTAPSPETERGGEDDDSLRILFMCCHPSLTASSQIALTLRAVGGLTTGQIANAFLVPEATMAQRISRAKATIQTAGAHFELPDSDSYGQRLAAVLHVLYLIFNEGYTATTGPDLSKVELSSEAIRLTRSLHMQMPDHGEITGLLALMLLTDARRDARTGPDGSLIPLAEQNRAQWQRPLIEEGVALISASLAISQVGPYQIQAAIAAVHDEAIEADHVDWPQILQLYNVLERMAPSPVVTLNRAVAVAMVEGAAAGLDLLATVSADPRMATTHRLEAVRAHLLEMSGDIPGAITAYRSAARKTTSLPEQRYLDTRAARLADS